MVNKSINMTISEIEKSWNEFKKAHKIKVSGSYDGEQAPEWFKEFVDYEFKPAITKLNSRIDNLVSKNNLKE